jgi:hypothetical protein
MNVLTAKGCATARACDTPPHHPGYAWAFAIFFVLGITIYAIYEIRRTLDAKAKANRESTVIGKPDGRSQEDQKEKTPTNLPSTILFSHALKT